MIINPPAVPAIKLKQKKAQQNHIPLITSGDKAKLDLKTYHVTLLGSEEKPVSTTIFLGKARTK